MTQLELVLLALLLVVAGIALAAAIHAHRHGRGDPRPGYLPTEAAPRAGRSVRGRAAAEVRPGWPLPVVVSSAVRPDRVYVVNAATADDAIAAALDADRAAQAADPPPPPPPAPGDSPPGGEAQRAPVVLDARAHVFGGARMTWGDGTPVGCRCADFDLHLLLNRRESARLELAVVRGYLRDAIAWLDPESCVDYERWREAAGG